MDTNPTSIAAEQSDLRGFLALLRRQRVLILACAVATALATLVSSVMAQEKFAASARLLYTDPGVAAGSIGGGEPERAVDTFVRLATTDNILQPLAGRLGITSTDDIRRATSVTGTPTSNIITVRATAPTAQAAARLANGVARSLISWREANRTRQLEARITFLREQIRGFGGKTSESEIAAASDLRTQLVESQAQLEVPNPELTLVGRATPPDTAFSPRTLRNVLLGLIAGLVLGLCAGALRDRLDRRLRTPDEIEGIYPWPTLGIVPTVDALGEQRTGLVDFAEMSPLADAYRNIRTNLTLVGLDQPDRKVIVVSSAMPGEGKSAAVANLASALAASGKRVMAISADLHAPALHEYLAPKTHSRPGLIEVLARESQPDDAVTRIPTRATRAAKGGAVFMIGNARVFSDPAVLLESAAMAALLKWARERYDVVLIDAPPLLYTAEASLLGRSADSLILIGRVNHLTRHEAARVVRLLETMQIRPLGVIVTGVRETEVEYGYGYRKLPPPQPRLRTRTASRASVPEAVPALEPAPTPASEVQEGAPTRRAARRRT